MSIVSHPYIQLLHNQDLTIWKDELMSSTFVYISVTSLQRIRMHAENQCTYHITITFFRDLPKRYAQLKIYTSFEDI
jgi:hypothetical protein